MGKTSLIKSIVQLCEDIVHVDSVSTPSSNHPPRGHRNSMNEVYASTKPYPEWWSTMEESRILRRRKSMGDSVLERNVCFVDTSNSVQLEKLIHYMEQQLISAVNSADQLSSEFSGLLSGRGASQVDVVLYLISKGTFLRTFDLNLRLTRKPQIPWKMTWSRFASCPKSATSSHSSQNPIFSVVRNTNSSKNPLSRPHPAYLICLFPYLCQNPYSQR